MTYPTIAALCRAENIDRRIIKAASGLGLPGFNTNRTINFELLGPALKEHEEEIKEFLKGGSLEDLKREEKRLGNELKRLEIQKRQGEYVDPTEWFQFFSDFGAELSTLLKSSRKTLMDKCRGYESVIDNEFIDLLTAIKSREDKCKPL